MTTGAVHIWIHDTGSSDEEQQMSDGPPETDSHRLQVERPHSVVEIQHGEIRLVLLEVARADLQVDGSEQSSRHPPLYISGSFSSLQPRMNGGCVKWDGAWNNEPGIAENARRAR